VHVYDVLQEFQEVLQRNGIRVPEDLGLAAVTQILDGTGLSGMQQNQTLMGAWAVELLEARIMHQDFGIPENPRIEMVESHWTEGQSLRTRH
jgi:LacI family transcriptional regulator